MRLWSVLFLQKKTHCRVLFPRPLLPPPSLLLLLPPPSPLLPPSPPLPPLPPPPPLPVLIPPARLLRLCQKKSRCMDRCQIGRSALSPNRHSTSFGAITPSR